ncbi:hint-domain-containing protein, partial [Entophlyctis helioformis]
QQAASANASLLVSIPNLRVGQSLDLIVPVRNIPSSSSEPLLEILVRYKPWNSDRFEAVEAVVSVATVSASIAPAEVSSHIQRLLFVDEIRSCLADAVGSNPPPAEQILQRIDRLAASIDPEIHKDLLVDLRGETRLALAQDNINRWGRHYLLGLTNAHALQLCTNFKDPGLQSYGGQLFSDLRTSFSAIFTKMKPPLTAKMAANRKARTPGVLELMVAETVDAMASFFSPVQACFAGNTLVLLANGSQRCISDLARGDVVATNASLSSTARVCCLVKTPCSSGMADLVTLDGGLRITPYHPVQQSGKWAFPCSIAEPASVPCYAVYNLVLDSNHTIIANGHATVTLGHGVANDPVASHPYFGTRAVVDDLECMRGWSSGTVVLAGVWRDDLTGLVCGLCEAEQDHDSHQADALAAVSSAPAAVVVC